MAWMIPAAIFGGALLGGSASRSAASTQADAATRASDAQLQMFREQALLQEPFRQAGVRALPQRGGEDLGADQRTRRRGKEATASAVYIHRRQRAAQRGQRLCQELRRKRALDAACQARQQAGGAVSTR